MFTIILVTMLKVIYNLNITIILKNLLKQVKK